MKKNNFLRNLSITTLAMCSISLTCAFSVSASYKVKVTAKQVFSRSKDCLPSVTSEVYFEENSDAENNEEFYDGVKTITITGGKADESEIVVVPYDIDTEGLGKCRPTRFSPDAIFYGVKEIAASSSIHLNKHNNEEAFVKICENNPILKCANYESKYGKVTFENL